MLHLTDLSPEAIEEAILKQKKRKAPESFEVTILACSSPLEGLWVWDYNPYHIDNWEYHIDT